MSGKTLTSVEKAAILLLGLGDDIAAEIMKGLSGEEVRKIAATISRLGKVDQVQMDSVLQEFAALLAQDNKVMVGGSQKARKILALALGSSVDLSYLEEQPSLDAIKSMSGKDLANLMLHEHPQTMALILAHAATKQAAETLTCLPENLRTDLILRLASMDSIEPTVIHDLNEQLRGMVAKRGGMNKKVGGADFAAKVLNQLTESAGAAVLEALDQKNLEVSTEVRKRMFTFADLIHVSQPGIAALIKAVDSKMLLLALKNAPESLKEHVFQCVSKRARALWEDDLSTMPKARLSEVEAAQTKIAAIAKKMVDDGVIDFDDATGKV